MITSISKVGSMIELTIAEKPSSVKFDVKTKTLFSFTGRQVKTIPKLATTFNSDLSKSVTDGYHGVLYAIRKALKGDYVFLNKIEMFIPYLNYIFDFSYVPNKCPKGYIKYVINNNLQICEDSLLQFERDCILKTLQKIEYEFFDKYMNKNVHSHYSNYYLQSMNSEQRKILIKITKIHTKTKTTDLVYLRNAIRGFIDEIVCIHRTKWCEVVDTNRDLTYNTKILITVHNAERQNLIEEKQKRILEIENLSNDKFTIIVPLELEQFADEGKQQNNCVGYFYHDSIIDNENLIYFIRKTKLLKKSYITNRYNIRRKKTVETRKVNNRKNNDENAHELIELIDKKITDLLNK